MSMYRSGRSAIAGVESTKRIMAKLEHEKAKQAAEAAAEKTIARMEKFYSARLEKEKKRFVVRKRKLCVTILNKYCSAEESFCSRMVGLDPLEGANIFKMASRPLKKFKQYVAELAGQNSDDRSSSEEGEAEDTE